MSIRSISWIKQARKDFLKFPEAVQMQIKAALNVALAGEKSDTSKPLSIIGSGVFEIALKYQSDAYRAVYALKIDQDIWVVHAFQKKSKKGIQTTKADFDLIKARIKALRTTLS